MTTPLIGQINLGPKIISMLESVGIKTLEDIGSIGPVHIYQRLERKYPNRTLPVCYYLYSLEGALVGKHWDDIGEERKKELLKVIGRNKIM